MKRAFLQNVRALRLFDKNDKLLLAISGGVDSTVLAHLLKECGFNFALAHCNFKLRGKESDGDERFCKQLAQKLGVAFYSSSFETKKYAATTKRSLQMAARELRYRWFETLCSEKKLDYVLTAHQAGDQVETILINLLRGTGSRGMKGILPKTKNVVRPLLPFKRDEIEEYAKKNKLRFRKDSSNKEDKYERNFLRLRVVPLLKKINPSLETTFIQNAEHFFEESAMLDELLQSKAKKLFIASPQGTVADMKKILKLPYSRTLLHHVLSPLGYSATQIQNIIRAAETENSSGKIFSSAAHVVALNRGKLILSPAKTKRNTHSIINNREELLKNPEINVVQLHQFSIPKNGELIISEHRLIYPICLREYKTGDKFQPFGMKHSKLLSDFFRENKLSYFDKQNKRLLVNGNNDIIWIGGMRSDERYRVKAGETALLKLSLER